MSIFTHIDNHELAGAISRLTHRINELERRRDSLGSTHTEPWSYQAANHIASRIAASLDREIRAEKRVLRDMRKAARA